MSTAANHRKRSHRSESLHRQGSTKHMINTIHKMNRRISFLDRIAGGLKNMNKRRRKTSDADGN